MLVASVGVLLSCFASEQGHRYSNTAQEQGDRRVGEYISSDWSFETSSYWIESPEGLILIDTQFLPSALRKKIRFAKWNTGKDVKLAIVLHSNPDRFNGTAWLQSQGVPVVTSEQIREAIPDVHAKWSSVFFEKYRHGGYPQTLALPDSLGSSTREFSAAGLTVKVHVLGSGCSPAHLVIEWEGHLFVGDLISSGAHSWFEHGNAEEWLHRLDELRALNPKWIHAGRGMTGGPELLEQQAEYLHTVIDAVASARKEGLPHREALARATETVNQRYPHHRYPMFLPMLLGAELTRQAESAP
ncbi:hypothetical protein DB31_1210 [Hyalangium minutum]|uniref:Metallo-beta-lactamase domain-containing protein n=1 Tax=Hyalangium minutum TaxID=394096 RepID=A0A085WEN2_9BACT|nr:hypothetical protein DB31_1210 [Hyalangium minutum]